MPCAQFDLCKPSIWAHKHHSNATKLHPSTRCSCPRLPVSGPGFSWTFSPGEGRKGIKMTKNDKGPKINQGACQAEIMPEKFKPRSSWHVGRSLGHYTGLLLVKNPQIPLYCPERNWADVQRQFWMTHYSVPWSSPSRIRCDYSVSEDSSPKPV